jgi:hypothetical protein
MAWLLIFIFANLLFWVALGYLLKQWPSGKDKSISFHSASQRHSYIFFSLSQSIAGLLSLGFILLWFVPQFRLGFLYSFVFGSVIALQLVSTWIPAFKNGRRNRMHGLAAYLMAYMMFIFTVMLAFADNLPLASRWIAGAAAVYMLFVIIGSITKYIMPRYLYFQVLYIVLFQSVILIAAFLGY